MNALTTTGAPQPTRARMQTIEAVKNAAGGFDIDAWHVMDARDNALIADELINGAGSAKFVYKFDIKGAPVTGISVVGARHLAHSYGGIKHRMVASVTKAGPVFTFMSYPQEGVPMDINVKVIHDLADEDDFFTAIVEVADIKTGNTIQVEKRENRMERSKGGFFERPHYGIIAQSKAYRNAVLALVPQDVQMRWKLQQLALDKAELITGSVIEEKRGGILRFASSKGLTIERKAVEALTMDQISGLSDAAKVGQEAFNSAGIALGIFASPETAPDLRAAITAETAAKPKATPAKAAPAVSAGPPETIPHADTVPAATTPTKAAAPAAAGFSAWLTDEWGEMVGDEEFTNAMSYAQALAATAKSATNITALLEINDAGIQAASAANSAARSILAGLVPADQNKAPEPVPVPEGRGGAPAWPPYVKAIKASLDEVRLADDLAAWATLNAPTIAKAPDAQRLLIVKAVGETASTMRCPMPPVIAAMISRAAAPEAKAAPANATEDRDEKWADATIAEFAKMGSAAELQAFGSNGAVRTILSRLRQEKPDLFNKVNAASAAALNRFGPPQDDGPEDAGYGDERDDRG